jgi:tryptophanyl-tRNA synthetase
VLRVPRASIREDVMVVPGTDGQKMSKSYGNIIDIFLPEKELRRQVMGIVTDSTPLEQPKDPDTCNVFNIYRIVAEPDQVSDMRQRYMAGGYGYGHAKQALFEVLLHGFAQERDTFSRLMDDRASLHAMLAKGAQKARPVGLGVLKRLRIALGYAN